MKDRTHTTILKKRPRGRDLTQNATLIRTFLLWTQPGSTRVIAETIPLKVKYGVPYCITGLHRTIPLTGSRNATCYIMIAFDTVRRCTSLLRRTTRSADNPVTRDPAADSDCISYI